MKVKQLPRNENSKIFPQRLMEILSDATNNDAITWLPSGRSFMIVNRQKMTSEVLPKYFPRTKYTSFLRKLNRWNFIRVTQGAQKGSFYNEFFRKGQEALCTQMYCNNARAKFAVSSKDSSEAIDIAKPQEVPRTQLVPSLIPGKAKSMITASASPLTFTQKPDVQVDPLANALVQNSLGAFAAPSRFELQQYLLQEEARMLRVAELRVKQEQLAKARNVGALTDNEYNQILQRETFNLG